MNFLPFSARVSIHQSLRVPFACERCVTAMFLIPPLCRKNKASYAFRMASSVAMAFRSVCMIHTNRTRCVIVLCIPMDTRTACAFQCSCKMHRPQLILFDNPIKQTNAADVNCTRCGQSARSASFLASCHWKLMSCTSRVQCRPQQADDPQRRVLQSDTLSQQQGSVFYLEDPICMPSQRSPTR